jgi:hypothetical protein
VLVLSSLMFASFCRIILSQVVTAGQLSNYLEVATELPPSPSLDSHGIAKQPQLTESNLPTRTVTVTSLLSVDQRKSILSKSSVKNNNSKMQINRHATNKQLARYRKRG